MEFTIPSPMGAQATLMAQRPARPAPDPTRVEKPPNAGKTRADSHNTQEHNNTQTLNNSQKRDVIEPPPDLDQPVGPPPTFQMNVLEMERELHQRLAQIEFSRNLEDRKALQETDIEQEDLVEQASDTDD